MVKEYIMSTYMMFYVLLLFIGFLMFLLESHFLIDLFIVLSSWTSTFVFVLMFRRIYPEENLWLFVKRQFNKRIKWSTMFSISMMSLIVLLCSIFTTYFIWDIPVYDQLLASWTSLLIIFCYNLLLGPLGEELGWRGFVLKELQEVYNPLISSIIVGFFLGVLAYTVMVSIRLYRNTLIAVYFLFLDWYYGYFNHNNSLFHYT